MSPAPNRLVPAMGWSFSGQLGAALLQIIYTAVMARLLEPRIFGVMAVCATLIRFAQFFSEMGISSALIQRPGITNREKTAFLYLSLGANLLLCLILWICAPLVTRILPEMAGQAILVLRILSLSCVISGAAQTGLALLRRDLDFKQLNLILLAAQFFGQICLGPALALAGLGIWSLVLAGLVQTLMTAILVWQRIRVSLRPVAADYRGLIRLSAGFSLLRILEAMGGYLPAFGVAFFLGITMTGLFDRAFALVILPLDYFASSLSKVLFPVFSGFQADRDRLGQAFVSVVGLAACVILPTALGMALARQELVLGVLGTGWTDALPFVPLITAYAGVIFISHFFGVVLDALGAVGSKTRTQGAMLLVLLAALWMIRPGSVASLLSLLLGAELLKLAALGLVVKTVMGYGPGDFLRMAWPCLMPTLAVGAAIGITRLAAQSLPVLLALLLCILAGAASLMLCLWLLRHLWPRDLLTLLSRDRTETP